MLAYSKLLTAWLYNYPSVSLCAQAQSLLALVVFQKLPSARVLVSVPGLLSLFSLSLTVALKQCSLFNLCDTNSSCELTASFRTFPCAFIAIDVRKLTFYMCLIQLLARLSFHKKETFRS